MAIEDTDDPTPVVDALRLASTLGVEAMKDIATAEAARAARLAVVRTRLQRQLAPDDPTLVALKQSIDASTVVASNLGTLADRTARSPVFAVADLGVSGQVLDASGAGVPRVFVHISDRARKLALGPRVTTDAAGDFSLAIKACELPAPVPDLFVIVEDSKGNLLAASSEPVTLQAGQPAYEEVVL